MEAGVIDVPVVILCGGRGVRLGGREAEVPKPLVEIGGLPILWHVMSIYAREGFKRFILCLGYKGNLIREWFMHRIDWRGRDFTLHMDALRGEDPVEYVGAPEDWDVMFVDTGLDTETGGRLLAAAAYFAESTFFVSYADGVSDLSVGKILAMHRAKGVQATMTCVRPRTHYGVVGLGPGGVVSSYVEKDRLSEYVNGGFFCFERAALKYIYEDEVLEREPTQRLIAARQLAAHVYDGFWHCMDTPKDHQVLNEMWARDAPWRMR